MKMVIGGAWQGQLAWARSHDEQNETRQWLDGKTCGPEEIFRCGGIYDFQEYIRRNLKTEGEDADAGRVSEQAAAGFAERLLRENPEILIVSNEIGYGLVPVSLEERIWREQTGRVCTALAARSEQVIRVVMGIGTRIKG